MKKVLFISSVPTHPTNAGNRVRILRMAEWFKANQYAVYMAFAAAHPAHIPPMQAFWQQQLLCLPPVVPSRRPTDRLLRKIKNVWQGNQPAPNQNRTLDDHYTERLDAWIQPMAAHDFAIVVAEYVTMAKALHHFPTALKVIDTHDVLSNRNQKFVDKGFRGDHLLTTTVAEEAAALNRADVVIAIQPHEKTFFKEISSSKVIVVGHAVSVFPVLPLRSPRRKLLFLASRHEANVVSIQHFVRKTLPIIRQTIPGVELWIAGRVCERMEDTPEYRKMGEVTDLTDAYQSADVAINPVLMGTGLKIKNIEALGYAKPLVTTSVGAEGLEDGVDTAFLVGDTPETFAAHVVKLLTDDAFCQTLVVEAHQFARTYNQTAFQELAELISSERAYPK